MTSRAFILLVPALLLAGCASEPSTASRGPYVRPGLVMLTADQAARRGINLVPESVVSTPPTESGAAPLDASAVIAAGAIKVYTVGRSVDETDSDLMHEEHVVYRREAAPRWRLDAPSNQKILVGPRITDGDEGTTPLLNKELASYLAEQRRAMDANQKAITALFEAVDTLNRQQQEVVRMAANGRGEPGNRGAESPRPAAGADTDSPPSTPNSQVNDSVVHKRQNRFDEQQH